MICSRCGKRIPYGKSCCPFCGYTVIRKNNQFHSYDQGSVNSSGRVTDMNSMNNASTDIQWQDSPYYMNNYPKKKSSFKKWLAISLSAILIVAVIAVVLVRKGFLSGADTDPASQTEEEEEAGFSKVTSSEDDLSEVVVISDPVLKKAIQDALNIGDREILKADALSLTDLVYSGSNNQKITDITGLSAFKNLTELDLNSNQISDIGVIYSMLKLKKLDLSNNQISDSRILSDLPSLTELELGGNQISDISALSGLTNLT